MKVSIRKMAADGYHIIFSMVSHKSYLIDVKTLQMRVKIIFSIKRYLFDHVHYKRFYASLI